MHLLAFEDCLQSSCRETMQRANSAVIGRQSCRQPISAAICQFGGSAPPWAWIDGRNDGLKKFAG